MITEKSLARKVLVLVSHIGVFNACKEALKKTGYEVIEDLETSEELDFVISREFGSGLWVDVMIRMGAVAESAIPSQRYA